MKQHIKLSRKRKLMIGIFLLSIATVAVYLVFLIPHSVTSTRIVQEGIRDETITTYPLSTMRYCCESLKILCIINIINVIIIIIKINRMILGIDD